MPAPAQATHARVSGVVPDGVAAAYLTAPDGTAVRADVADNAYAFVVPAPRDPGHL